jgi:hypothetical protein
LIDLRANHPDVTPDGAPDIAATSALYSRMIRPTDSHALATLERVDNHTPDERAAQLLHAYAHTVRRRADRIRGASFAFALHAWTPAGDVHEVCIVAQAEPGELPGDPPAITLSIAPDVLDA